MSHEQKKCSYEKCHDIKSENKSCHYCFTYYCSKECREADWTKHKTTKCYYGRLSSHCKRILAKAGRSLELRRELSRIAYTGYQSWDAIKKRGFVWLDFSNESEAEEFLNKPLNQIKKTSNFLAFFGDNTLPKYVYISPELSAKSCTQNDMILSHLFLNYLTKENKIEDDELNKFIDLISNYEPSSEFILLTSVRVNKNDINQELKPKRPAHLSENVMYAFKFMKMSLKLEKDLQVLEIEEEYLEEMPMTLILTSLNKNQDEDSQENRELFLANLLNEFQMRGINLRAKFPKIYRDLCLYVEENRPFTPLCLFPRDLNKNNLFMCLIMPNSQPVDYPTWLNETNAHGLAGQSEYESENYELIQSNLNLSKYLQIK